MTTIPLELDAGTEAALGWVSAVLVAVDAGMIPPTTALNVAHALAEVMAQARLDALEIELAGLDGPTDDELAEIEAEADVIAAELAVVAAEIRHLDDPSVASRRRLRRAQDALTLTLLAHSQPETGDTP
jgi:hypothetical protein